MKSFTKNDEAFVCQNCGKQVEKLGYTSRNHCPYCLFSIHIDNIPGDRENQCKGLMKPINVEITKKGKVIVFKCLKCGIIKRNVSADDDNEKEILRIMSNH